MRTHRGMLIIANWKMNPRALGEAKVLFLAIKKHLKKVSETEVVIAPPFVYLADLQKNIGKSPLLLGAQNVSSEVMGALTGEVSVGMLQGFGVSHVIIGHSERRARGETDLEIEKKTALVLKAGLTAVVCVGERERDTSGKYFGVVEEQLRAALRGVVATKLAHLVVAYEPVWAISTASATARAATPDDAHEMVLFIRKILTDLYGRGAAERVRILYGGSVDQKNVAALVAGGGSQGFLVGGASLRPLDFSTIITTTYER